MDRKIIRKYVIEEKNEVIELGLSLVPSCVPCPRSGSKFIKVEDFREFHKPSSLEKKFKKFISTKSGNNNKWDYVQEFPIPIINKKLWRDLCMEEEARDSIVVDKGLLCIDYFLYNIRVAIELDGKQHKEELNRKSDKVRDRYLEEMYGIKTLRLPEFGCNPKNISQSISLK